MKLSNRMASYSARSAKEARSLGCSVERSNSMSVPPCSSYTILHRSSRPVGAAPSAHNGHTRVCSVFILLYLGKVVKQESDSVCSSILHFFGAFVQKGENVSPPGRKS